MSIPKHLLDNDDDCRLFSRVGRWMDEEAERRTGRGFNLKRWERQLPPAAFDLIVLTHFMGTWENSGSFVNEAANWYPEMSRVQRALSRFGCAETAARFEAAAGLAAEIDEAYENDQDPSPDLQARRKAVDDAAEADVTYAKLSAYIRAHPDEFL